MTGSAVTPPPGPAAVKSAARALAVLELVAEDGGAGAAEIADALGVPRSSLHGLLRTLEAAGWLERRPGNRFTLGLRAWEVGQRYGGHRDLLEVAQPVMDGLRDEVGETVQLARLHGTDNVYIAISHSPHPMRLASSVGVRLPAHATGIGKALLAQLDPAELRRRLEEAAPLPAMTPRTLTATDRLARAVAEAAARGHALDEEEYLAGCVCVAVPLGRDGAATPLALSVTVPTTRVRRPWPESMLTPLQRAADRISAGAGLTGADGSVLR